MWWCQHTFGRQKQGNLWVQVSLICRVNMGCSGRPYLTQNGTCYINICLYICNQSICFDNLFYFEIGSHCVTQINLLSPKFWDYNYGTLTDIKDHMYLIAFHEPTPTRGSYSLCLPVNPNKKCILIFALGRTELQMVGAFWLSVELGRSCTSI